MIPKQLRDELGLRPGEVEVSAYGAGLRVEAIAGDESLEERDSHLLIPAAGLMVDDDLVQPASRCRREVAGSSCSSTQASRSLSVADHEHHEATSQALGRRRPGARRAREPRRRRRSRLRRPRRDVRQGARARTHDARQTRAGYLPHTRRAGRAPRLSHPRSRGGGTRRQVRVQLTTNNDLPRRATATRPLPDEVHVAF